MEHDFPKKLTLWANLVTATFATLWGGRWWDSCMDRNNRVNYIAYGIHNSTSLKKQTLTKGASFLNCPAWSSNSSRWKTNSTSWSSSSWTCMDRMHGFNHIGYRIKSSASSKNQIHTNVASYAAWSWDPAASLSKSGAWSLVSWPCWTNPSPWSFVSYKWLCFKLTDLTWTNYPL